MDAQRRRPPRDRLSDLHDDILGHILSFLPAEEAGRAAILSRRWRRTFADVHTISFQQAPSDDVVRRRPNRWLADRITAALLARRRSRAGDSQLRSFRVAMCPYDARNSSSVHRWLSYAVGNGVQELQLETRRRGDFGDAYLKGDICAIDDSDSDDSSSDFSDLYSSDSSDSDDSSSNYRSSSSGGRTSNRFLPAKLYSCASLRTLHLSSCSTLDLPSTINLPSMETLALTNITYAGSREDIQRLITSCPRLADLTLEACSMITDITVPPETRLRSFAMRCCHGFRGITLDLSETRAFEYRGRRLEASRFTLVGGGEPGRIASAKIHMCSGEIDLGKFLELLLLFVSTANLHLGWPELILSSQPGYGDFLDGLPMFHNVTRLQLASRCMLPSALRTVAGILEHTPNLTALSLKLGDVDSSIAVPVDEQEQERGAVGAAVVEVPEEPVKCLRERLRELSVEQYEGRDVQRRLLRWLLRGSPVIETVRVVFAKGGYSVLDQLTDQIKRWTANPAATTTFL